MKTCRKGHTYELTDKQCPECAKLYYKSNSARITARNRAWDRANPDKVKAQVLKKYGLSFDQYNQMVKDQRNKCAICKTKETYTSKNGLLMDLAVDHCHETGKVRGLLCGNCNRAIGHLRDSPKLCLKAARYLRKHDRSD